MKEFIMRYNPIDPRLFTENRHRLSTEMKTRSIAVVVSNDEMPRNGDQYFPYRQNSDLFYLTGIEQEKTILVMAPTHPNPAFREMLFIINASPEEEQWNGHKLTKKEAQDISGIKTVKYLEELDFFLKDLLFWAKRAYLAVNEYPKFFPENETRDKRYAEKFKKAFPLVKTERLGVILTSLRQAKQPQELECIRKAIAITGKAFDEILKNLAAGMKEFEVEALMTYHYLRQGASGHAFRPIIASGKNACVLHYVTNHNTLQNNDLLLMDFGAEYANYAADCSRTVPINGKYTPRQKECYNAVLRTVKKATELYIPGNTINKVNEAVWKMMEKEMIGLGLFTEEDVKNQDPANPCYFRYLMHGVCHPVGLDVHDVGGKDDPFPKGQVLTLEPGIYIPEEGIGIRIENDILVDDTPVNLMEHIPVEAEDIEEIMAQKNND